MMVDLYFSQMLFDSMKQKNQNMLCPEGRNSKLGKFFDLKSAPPIDKEQN